MIAFIAVASIIGMVAGALLVVYGWEDRRPIALTAGLILVPLCIIGLTYSFSEQDREKFEKRQNICNMIPDADWIADANICILDGKKVEFS